MIARTARTAHGARSSHLGERRFLEYPQILGDEWATAESTAQQVFTSRRVLLGAVALAALLSALLLFG